MGAYVIERSIRDAMNSNKLFAALQGILVSISLFCAYIIWSTNSNLRVQASKLRQLANVDPLTGCLNRRALESHIINISKGEKNNAAVILMDIDHFKKINDTHGHDIGDKVLVWFTETVRIQLRESDVLARVGGEEFIIYLPNTPEKTAISVSERIRNTVAEHQLNFGTSDFNVTVSMGAVHTARAPSRAFSTYGKIADSLLYRAKSSGRNKVIWAPTKAVTE